MEELGNYETSYFIMNVPTEADIDILNMSDADFAVFFHEYIHFLQDITSLYGYMGIYDHGEYMRRAINDIYKMPNKIKVPLSIEETDDCVVLNKDIAKFSQGDKSDLDFVVITDYYTEDYPLTNTFSIPELHIKAVTNTGPEEFVLGAYAIRENMAYLLERKCTTGYKRSCDYPYRIVEILANKMCPGKLMEEDLIALCDVTLQSSVPGYGLYQYLNAVKENRLIISKPEDFYDFLLSKNTRFLGKEMSIPEALMEASKQATDHLLSYVKIDQLSRDYQDWVIYTMGAGIALRLLQPYFFIEMARGERNKRNGVLQFIAKNIGSPQIVNAVGKRCQLETDRRINKFEYLEVVKEIERLFEYGIRGCCLKPWCKVSPDGAPVDERCDKEPWRRCDDQNLCPYGLLWRHWNLARFEVVD